MDKLAEFARSAEVRGAVAAFIDTGMLKVASQEAFEDLVEKVAEGCGEDYDLPKVAAVTLAVVAQDQQKVAEEEVGKEQEATTEQKTKQEDPDPSAAESTPEVKTAMEKVALVGNALIGAFRGAGLSDAQRAALAEHYGMDEDSSFALRNAARSAAGGALGSAAGSFVGGSLGRSAGKAIDLATGVKNQGLMSKLLGQAPAGGGNSKVKAAKAIGKLLGGVGGGVAGMWSGGSKYSEGTADKLLQQKALQQQMALMQGGAGALPMGKQASAVEPLSNEAKKQALGDLLLQKMAGQIDDDIFVAATKEVIAL